MFRHSAAPVASKPSGSGGGTGSGGDAISAELRLALLWAFFSSYETTRVMFYSISATRKHHGGRRGRTF